MSYDDFDDDELETDSFLMLGFSGVDSLLSFIHWVYETFDTDEEFTEWFNTNMNKTKVNISSPPKTSLTYEENDTFWNIVSKEFKNHKEGPHDNLSGAD
jgi:hypothetical protein